MQFPSIARSVVKDGKKLKALSINHCTPLRARNATLGRQPISWLYRFASTERSETAYEISDTIPKAKPFRSSYRALSITVYNTHDWATGPTTPAARLFHAYARNVESASYRQHSQDRYYSNNVSFHNCNGAIYHGAIQMRTWMKELFAPFDKISHIYEEVQEIDNGDGTYTLNMRGFRKVWVKGKQRASDRPDVVAPFCWVSLIAPEPGIIGSPQERLRIQKVWLYWDVAPLRDMLSSDAVVFRKDNPY